MKTSQVWAFSVLLVASLGGLLDARAQDALPAKSVKGVEHQSTLETPKPEAPLLQFNADPEIRNQDSRAAMQFKVVDEKEEKESPVLSVETAADSPFKAYPGYPKHQLEFKLVPTAVASTWSFGSQDFSYNSTSSSAFGLGYNFLVTPAFRVELNYSSYSLKVAKGSVFPYEIAESNVTVSNTFVNLVTCRLGDSNFYNQLCWGFELGQDAYPVLGFTPPSNNNLALSKVTDYQLGLNLASKWAVFGGVNLQTKLGYRQGLGAGNTGELTSKNNSAYLIGANLDYEVGAHSSLLLGVDYQVRNAKVEGKVGNNNDSWTSKVTTAAGQLTYQHTF